MSPKQPRQDNGKEFAQDEISLLGLRVDPARGVAEVRVHATAENQVFLFEVRMDRDLKSGILKAGISQIFDQVRAQLATLRAQDSLSVRKWKEESGIRYDSNEKPQTTNERAAIYQAFVEKLHQDSPTLPYPKLKKQAAQHFGVSLRTMSRRTHLPPKK